MLTVVLSARPSVRIRGVFEDGFGEVFVGGVFADADGIGIQFEAWREFGTWRRCVGGIDFPDGVGFPGGDVEPVWAPFVDFVDIEEGDIVTVFREAGDVDERVVSLDLAEVFCLGVADGGDAGSDGVVLEDCGTKECLRRVVFVDCQLATGATSGIAASVDL